MFVDESNGDLHLSAYSLAINAGDKEAVTGISKDLAGNARIHDNQVDIGAYEYNGSKEIPKNLKPTIALFIEHSKSKNPLSDADVSLYSIPIFADLDGDNDLDAVIGRYDEKIDYYENIDTVLTQKKDVFNDAEVGGYDYGADVSGNSSPALVDIDNDGKLEVFFGNKGGMIGYYKNTENANSPKFELQNASNPFNDVSIQSGYSTPTFVEIDKDGDFDVFIGEQNGTLQYYENTGTNKEPTFVKRLETDNPLNNIDVGEHSKPTFVNFDHDGDFDAFIGKGDGFVDYYENIGTERQPYFTRQVNPFAGIDMRSNSAPTFVDWDEDGDWDAFLGKFDGTISYYENIGPVTGSRFLNQALVFKAINVGKLSAPSLVDIDNDGDLDAFIGEKDGTINYYKNTDNTVKKNNPSFLKQTSTANPFEDIDIGNSSHLAFADLDQDKDYDAFIGEQNGTIKYYQNTGTKTQPIFEEKTDANPLNHVKLGSNDYSKPAFVDINDDGKLDVFIGERYAKIHYFQNEGSDNDPNFVKQTEENNPFNNVDVGWNPVPTFVDFDKDGDFDAFVGERRGIINYFENTGTASKPQFVARTGNANPFVDVNVKVKGYYGYSAPFLADIDNDTFLDALIGELHGTIQHYEYTTITNALPRGGNYNFAPQVYLKCVTCDKFYYTVDGSTPKNSSTLYNDKDPIAISANTTTTLKYISVSDGFISEVTTETYRIDTQAPGVTIAVPENQAELASLPIINGTATDDGNGIGVDYIEVQITDNKLYLTRYGGLVPTATWLKATGIATGTDNLSYEWSYDTSKVTFPAGDYSLKVRAFDKLGNISIEKSRIVGIAKGLTTFDLKSSSATILNEGELSLTGQLNRYPATSENLSGLKIIITVTDPNNLAQDFEVETDSENQFSLDLNKKDENEKPIGTQYPFTTEGKYSFAAKFAGNDKLVASNSLSPVNVLVGQSAGYVLLIQGQIASDPEGSKAYNKTTNRIYQKLIDRGFKEENIFYFNFNQTEVGVDAIPESTAIKTALLNNLKNRFKSSPAPLYIIMVNHGGKDGHFYIDNGKNEEITANDLSDWMNRFEEGLDATALKQPRIAIIGSCYSGSFIKRLSKKTTFAQDGSVIDAGRIIIASASAKEVSYKGPKEEDEIRSGEFFMEELFQQLGRGESLKTSFEYAVERTETFTHRDANATMPFNDQAAQHPLLDDNGDKEGSNTLFIGQEQDGQKQDGQIAQNIYLGVSKKDPNEAIVTAVTDTIYLDASTTTELFALVNNVDRVEGDKVILNIRTPNFILPIGDDSGKQVEIDLIEKQLSCLDENKLDENITKCTGNIAGFDTAGQYEVYYFVRDTKTKNISPVKRSVVYKNQLDNKPPKTFSLESPANHDENQKTVVLFKWERSLDKDSNRPVIYNLLLSKNEDFSTVVHRQEGLTTTMTYIDKTANVVRDDGQTGLKDQTTYYWKVQAVDSYGSTTESAVFWFKTNNTNDPPSIGSVHISSALDFTPIKDATFVFLDENGNPLSDFNFDMYQDQGHYHMSLPRGRRRARIRVADYQEQEIELDTYQGTEQLNVKMIPISGKLQFSSSTYSATEGDSTVNLNVIRTGDSDGQVSVQYMISGTAALNTDYTGGTGTLTWSDGDNTDKQLNLNLIDDEEVEKSETLDLILFNPTGEIILGNPAQATLTIVDNDEPGVAGTLQFKTATQTVNEGKEVTLTVTRAYGNDGEVSVEYMTTGESTATGSDYTGGSGTLTWTDGDSDDKSLTLNITDDDEVEDTETIQLILMAPIGGVALGSPIQTSVTIIDNDVAIIEEKPAPELVTPAPEPVTSAPEPVTPAPEPVISEPAPETPKPETPAPITTSVIDAETAPNSSQAGTLQFASTTYMAEESEGQLNKITVTRTHGSTGEISVQYLTTVASTATYGKDFSGGNGTLTWADGETGAKSIILTLIPDDEVESVETVNLMLSNPTGQTLLGTQTQTTLLITDNVVEIEPIPEESSTQNVTAAGVLQFFAPFYTINEGIGNLNTFTVTRSEGYDGEVSVQYTITDEGTATPYHDYVGGFGKLVWTDGDETPKPISLMILDDTQIEEWETISLVLFKPTGDAKLGVIEQASLIIADNDGLETLEFSPEQSSSSPNEKPEGQEPIINSVSTPENEASSPGSESLSEKREQTTSQKTETEELVFSALPSLGNGMAISTDGTILDTKMLKNRFDTEIRFQGGAKAKGQDYRSLLTLSSSRQVEIAGEIKVDIAHIGKTADILIVKALINPTSNTQKQFYMFDNDGQIVEWDGDLATLIAAEQEVTLSENQAIAIYRGWLKPGLYQIYFGYRFSNDGLIFFNGEQPIQVQVKENDDEYAQKPELIWHTAWSLDGSKIATASNDGHISLWEANTGNRLARLQGHSDPVKSVAFSPNGKLMITASHDKTARLWNIEKQQAVGILRGHQSEVEKAIFSPDGRQIATASSDGTARLWSVGTLQEVAILKGHEDGIKQVTFSNNGQQLVTASWDGTARLWKVETGKILAVLPHNDVVEHATFSPSDEQVVTTSWDKTARLWDAYTGQAIRTLKGHRNVVAYATFSPNGQYLVTTSWDNSAHLWKVRTGKLLWVREHQAGVHHAAFSPDGKMIITGSNDGTARLWETATGKPLKTLKGHQGNVWQVGFSPDGKRVISASWDNSVRVWEVDSGEVIMMLKD